MTAEEIVREIYGNNYTIDDLKRIEEQFKNAIEAAKKLAESEAVVIDNTATA